MFTSIAFIEPTLSWSMTDLDFASLRPGCLKELLGFCSITIVNTAPGKTILRKAGVVLTHDAYARPREADREVLLAHKDRLHMTKGRNAMSLDRPGARQPFPFPGHPSLLRGCLPVVCRAGDLPKLCSSQRQKSRRPRALLCGGGIPGPEASLSTTKSALVVATLSEKSAACGTLSLTPSFPPPKPIVSQLAIGLPGNTLPFPTPPPPPLFVDRPAAF